VIKQPKQYRKESGQLEDKNKGSMSYSYSSSREYWSGRDCSHIHTDREQQQLQNYQEYTSGRMTPPQTQEDL
jgi:hypothetical protein